jgi:uncharacterized YccA/Bax inhibitor family protein
LNTTAIESHVDDLLFDLREMTVIGVVQDEGATLTVMIEASIARFSLCGSSMSIHIDALATWARNRFYYH